MLRACAVTTTHSSLSLLARAKVYTRGEKRKKKKVSAKRGSGYFRLKGKKRKKEKCAKGYAFAKDKRQAFQLDGGNKATMADIKAHERGGGFSHLSFVIGDFIVAHSFIAQRRRSYDWNPV